jgi:hypothetical protein
MVTPYWPPEPPCGPSPQEELIEAAIQSAIHKTNSGLTVDEVWKKIDPDFKKNRVFKYNVVLFKALEAITRHKREMIEQQTRVPEKVEINENSIA